MSEDKDKDKKSGPVAEAIQSKFIEDRKVFLWGEVSDKSARDITEKLLHLEATDPGKEITFYINSPGGSITAGHGHFRYHAINQLAHQSCGYGNGCEYGIYPSLRSIQGAPVFISSLTGTHSPASHHWPYGCRCC